MRKFLVGFLVVVLYFCINSANADAKMVKNWQLCTLVSEFPIQILGTDIVLQKVGEDIFCYEMDSIFFQKLRAAGFHGKANASAVKKWLPKRIQLPHEHMLMTEVDKKAQMLNLDFCH